MGTVIRYPRRVARQRYSPPSREIEARVAAVVARYRRLQEEEARYKSDLASLADPDGDAVPIAYLADQLGVTRKTVYRHLGRSMT